MMPLRIRDVSNDHVDIKALKNHRCAKIIITHQILPSQESLGDFEEASAKYIQTHGADQTCITELNYGSGFQKKGQAPGNKPERLRRLSIA